MSDLNKQEILDKALVSLESTSSTFAHTYINDSSVRREYINTTKIMSEKIMEQVNSGKLTIKEGVEEAQFMRNQIMEIARDKTSPLGLAKAKEIKQTGKTLSELFERNSEKLFEKSYATLDNTQQEKVHLKIIESSGAPNQRVNAKVDKMSKLGKGLGVLSLAIAAHSIYEAENKLEATGREVSTLGGSILGGAASGATAGIWLGPIGVGVCSVVGAIAGGLGAREIFNHVVESEKNTDNMAIPDIPIDVGQDNHVTIPLNQTIDFSNDLDQEALEQRVDSQSQQILNLNQVQDRQSDTVPRIDTYQKSQEMLAELYPHLVQHLEMTNRQERREIQKEEPNPTQDNDSSRDINTSSNTFENNSYYVEDDFSSMPKNHRPTNIPNNLPQQSLEEDTFDSTAKANEIVEKMIEDNGWNNNYDNSNDYDAGMEID